MCMDPSYALVNSTNPSHALLFQSVRYIAFFKREKSLQFICFRPRLRRRCRPPSRQSFIAVQTHAFVKCDMLHETPLCACFSALFASSCFFFCVVFLFSLFFSCVSFSRKVSIRQNVKTTTVQNLPERERERERDVRVWLGRQTAAADEENSSATCWQLDTCMSNQEPSGTAGAVWSSNSGLRSWHRIKRDRSIQRDDMIQDCIIGFKNTFDWGEFSGELYFIQHTLLYSKHGM